MLAFGHRTKRTRDGRLTHACLQCLFRSVSNVKQVYVYHKWTTAVWPCGEPCAAQRIYITVCPSISRWACRSRVGRWRTDCLPGRRAVGVAGTEEGDAGDTDGWLGGEDGSATGDAASAAPGYAKVGNDSGTGTGKGSLRPVRRRCLKRRRSVLASHNSYQERRPVLR